MPQLNGDFNVAEMFEKYQSYMSDVSTVDYTSGSEESRGFGEKTKVFNDGITFQIVSMKDHHKYDLQWGRDVLSAAFGKGKPIIRVNNGAGASIKLRVEASQLSVAECLSQVSHVLEQHRRLRLVSIDFTMDCANITTRTDIEAWLPEHTVIAERAIQLLESAGVFEKNGSSLHVLMKDGDLRDTTLQFKEQGVSRIEITFYSECVSDPKYYLEAMHAMHGRLQTCRTYTADVGDQWTALLACITQTIALYHEPSKTFGYCHWWNSLTKKMQGASRSNVHVKDIDKLLGNFSFYDRPMYFIRINNKADEAIKIYMRNYGGDPMTMIPGERGGFYPCNPQYQLSDYGMGSVPPGYIGWKSKYSNQSAPLAQISEIRPDEIVDALALEMSKLAINPKDYSSDFDVLEVGSTYTIISYGTATWYNRPQMFAKTLDGKQIRCTEPLTNILRAREAAGDMAVFDVIVTKKVKPNGKKT
ncbi:hypothetical protein BGZ67_010185, partial [Mortierella alpina]